jgi:hypothetical protein
MKNFTIEELITSDKSDLHVRLPSVLDKLLRDDANNNHGRNKSLLIIHIVAEYYGVLASS